MVANSLVSKPPPRTLGIGSIGRNSTFSDIGHVIFQIKWNHEMQQHGSKYFARRALPYDPGGQKVKMQLFSKHGHVHIKLKGITNAAT